ncbi:MAG: hypothetical protein DRG78_08465 [Epsilonproteobacteria bacterium]|nr:MAG: hypothetical protein DRG78_08465 [Campylobacterota bacterium]
MFIDVSVKDMINVKAQKVNYNEVIILRNDIVTMPNLMSFLSNHKIHFDQSLRLDSLTILQQNELGVIFFEHYGFIIYNDGSKYLDREKFNELLSDSETIMSYFKRSENLAPTNIDNALNYHIFTSKQFNDIILHWFSSKYRNFRSIEKFIKKTTQLYDIDINRGQFNKIIDRSKFLAIMFNRYIRMQKGSIPFSDDYGSSIKQSLHKKADYFTKKIILEELNFFVVNLSSLYEDDFRLIDIYYVEEISIATKLIIYITLQANDESPLQFRLLGD